MYEQYMGVIKALGFQFTPAEWGLCNGQILDINQFTALFSLLGCSYGGDCRSSFGLPDLRGRVPMGWGQSPGLSPRAIGTHPGWYQEVLSFAEMPSHTHSFTYSGGSGAGSNLSFNLHVASNSAGKKNVPSIGDYIAGPGNALGIVQENLFLAPTDVTATAQIGGVSVAGNIAFHNELFSVGSTPQATQAVTIQQPAQAVHYSMCMEGLYPSRS